jgi:light-regulated signal transduction histidine kinase (bacteriophytochrome)
MRSAGVFAAALVLGSAVFGVLRLLPIRALNRALAANSALIGQLTQHEAELTRSNQELQQFAFVASHDLQEPLRMITSYTQLLAKRYRGKLDADADEFIGYAVDGARRIQGLISDLLNYSRVGAYGGEFLLTDCEAIITATLKNLEAVIGESNAVVHHDGLPTVNGDRIQLTQLFQNLVSNAIKYHCVQAPQIHISCDRQEHSWLFCVRDNGIGIDPQFAEKVFVIFQRLHTKEAYPGNGIGLAICKKIVEHHGGKIWVESEVGQGSKFYFTIPTNPAVSANHAILSRESESMAEL